MALETIRSYMPSFESIRKHGAPYMPVLGGAAAIGGTLASGGTLPVALGLGSLGMAAGKVFKEQLRPYTPDELQAQQMRGHLLSNLMAQRPEGLDERLSAIGGQALPPDSSLMRQQLLQQALLEPSSPRSLIGETIGGALPFAGRFAGEKVAPFLGGHVSPDVASGAGEAIGGLLQKYIAGKTQASPMMASAKEELLEQMRGPSPFKRTPFEPIRERAMKEFRERVMPGIMAEATAAGVDGGSGALARQVASAEKDLSTRLAELESQHESGEERFAQQAEQQRRGALADFISGQQQIGLRGFGELSREGLGLRELQLGAMRALSESDIARRRAAGETLGTTERLDIERERSEGARKDALIKAATSLLKGKQEYGLGALGKYLALAGTVLAPRFDIKGMPREKGAVEALLSALSERGSQSLAKILGV